MKKRLFQPGVGKWTYRKVDNNLADAKKRDAKAAKARAARKAKQKRR